jgi:nucleotide-binding universal stress UspA family protein
MSEPELDAVPRRILLAVDGEPANGPAFNAATALASALGAELVLLGITPAALAFGAPPPTFPLAPDEVVAEQDVLEGQTRERLAEAEGQVPSGVRSRTVFGWEPAGQAIVDAAREEEVDLVVLPMHRGGELAHLLRDGADRHVLHHSPVPVLVVPEA